MTETTGTTPTDSPTEMGLVGKSSSASPTSAKPTSATPTHTMRTGAAPAEQARPQETPIGAAVQSNESSGGDSLAGTTDVDTERILKPKPDGEAGQELPDPRPGFWAVTELVETVLGQMSLETNRNASPCEGYDAGGMGSHLVAVLLRIAAVARGEDPFSVPQEIVGLEPDGFVAAWRSGLEECIEAWSDPQVLTTPLVLPFGTLPGSVALAVYIGELLIHTWDLSQSLGIDVEWDEVRVLQALETMKIGLPAEPRGGEMPFGPVVVVGGGARAIDKLVAWSGRDPLI